MTVRWRGRHVFDQIGASLIEGLPQYIVGTQYFVSAKTGSDTNAGTSPDKPLETIQAAITKANATIDWAKWPEHKPCYIWVEPGVYAENLTPAYSCFIIGQGVRGTDTMAEVRPASGSCFTGTFLGTVLVNLRFEHLEASKPVFDLGICNNSKVLSCEFALGADVDGVAGIDTENATHLVVEDCDFLSLMGTHAFEYGIYHRGGADKFAAGCIYRKNRIWTETAGIWIATDCVASGSIAEDNFIHGTGTSTGIDGKGGGADTGSQLMAVRNRIVIDGAGDAIHGLAAGNKLANLTNVNGSYAQETA